MSVLNDELNVSVLEGGTLMGPVLRLVARRTTENANCCISDVDEAALPVTQWGLIGTHTDIIR